MMTRCATFAALLLMLFARPALAQSAADVSAHTERFVPVARDVTLEVLDWGGNGPPLVFLTGWGNTAHIFDSFAPKFTDKHHVYAITRRGFGRSSKPSPATDNYDADRLGDDVLAVLDALKLDHPVLVGHSVAGEEMSSIATRHPDRVAGLVYLEAAYAFAFYDPEGGYTVQVEADEMRRRLEELMRADADPARSRALIGEIQQNIPLLQRSLQRDLSVIEGLPQPPLDKPESLADQEGAAMRTGRRKYSALKLPVLAIIADPYDCRPGCDKPDQIAWSREMKAQADAFEKDNPHARVVRLPYASHYIFQSNQAQVIREMNMFLDSLPSATP